MIERRQLPRTKVAQPAKVLAVDADVGHDCTVENLNTLGACIFFDAATIAELPRKFDLTFDNCHTYWRCDVIWRDGDVGRVGVSWKNALINTSRLQNSIDRLICRSRQCDRSTNGGNAN